MARPPSALVEKVIRNGVPSSVVDDLQREERIEFGLVSGMADRLRIALAEFRAPVHKTLYAGMPACDRRVPATTAVIGAVLQRFLAQQSGSVGRFECL